MEKMQNIINKLCLRNRTEQSRPAYQGNQIVYCSDRIYSLIVIKFRLKREILINNKKYSSHSTMNCSLCNLRFDCVSRLPVLNPTGSTLCSQCMIVDSTQNLVYNKQLIRILGYCPDHIGTKLSLLCIDNKKHVCEKCILYGKKPCHSSLNNYVQISKIPQAISIKTKELQITLTKVGETRQQIQNAFKSHQNKCFHKIEEQYLIVLQQLNKKREQAYNQILLEMRQLRQKTVNKCLEEFQKLNQKIMGSKQNKSEKILFNKIQNLKSLKYFSQNLEVQFKLVCGQLQKFSKAFDFKLEVTQKLEDGDLFSLSLDDEEESLNEFQDMQVNSSNLNISWFKFDQETETASNMSFSSLPICGQTPVKQRKDELTITTTDACKIGSNIRIIKANGCGFSNTQATKLMETIKKSFASSVDLSSNRITAIFLRDLSKMQIGKYLKSINLQGNQINSNDPNIRRKLESLKKQGVKILV